MLTKNRGFLSVLGVNLTGEQNKVVNSGPFPSTISTHLKMFFACMQAGLFARAGVRKVRLTGGEPTLRRDLVDLTAGIRSLPGIEAVGLTTNGLTLSRKLAALQTAGNPLVITLPCNQGEHGVLFLVRHSGNCEMAYGCAAVMLLADYPFPAGSRHGQPSLST